MSPLVHHVPLHFLACTNNYTAGIVRRRRASTGSLWRKLSPGRQALPVLAYLGKGETFA